MDQAKRSLQELVDSVDPGWVHVLEWSGQAIRPVELLPPSSNREQVLLDVQVTTRSTMGAIAYESGGILVDNGWLRILGSGHIKLARTLPGWNEVDPIGSIS